MFLLIIVVCLLVRDSSCSSSTVPTSEVNGLEYIYNSTDGANWLWRPESGIWNFTGNPDPCGHEVWQGVSCYCPSFGLICHISGLILNRYDLVGLLPNSFALLPALETLSLQNNRHLVGSIPQSLCDLPALVNLTLNNNRFSGPIPGCIGSLSLLATLDLSNNNLSQSIPVAICSLSSLQSFIIDFNIITGRLPDCVDSLSSMVTWSSTYAFLTGTIPSEFGALVNMSTIDLSDNFLRGSVPSEFCALSLLNELILVYDLLTGSIPTCIGQLTSMKQLYIMVTLMSGTIPSGILELKQLEYFFVDYNFFSGTVPDGWDQIPSLREIGFNNNHFTGTFPQLWPSGTQQIFAQENRFTGTIPSSLAVVTFLREISLFKNSFTGTLPSSLGTLSAHLVYISFNNNCLTGTMPTSYGDLTILQFLYANDNFFSGSVGRLPFMSSSVTDIDISNNLFTGQFPFDLSGTSVVNLYLGNNKLTGSIGSDLSLMRYVKNIDIGSNAFEGTLPLQLNSVALAMEVLLIAGNNFEGQLLELFNSSVFVDRLTSVDLSENGFTGSLPMGLFQSSSLTEFIASNNCFTGSISTAVCNAASLQALDLSGSHGGRNCMRTYPWPLTFHMYGHVPGSIPECLFASPTLELLSLSGNGMRSKLYDVGVAAGSKLKNVNLAYNRLEGTIPLSIQQYTGFLSLDLSYNRLSGTIEEMVYYKETVHNASNTSQLTLSLESNRLSGEIPPQFKSARSINILDGNMFGCESSGTLPQNDPHLTNYVCGSQHLEMFLYAALCAAIFRAAWIKIFSDGFEIKLFSGVLPKAVSCLLWTADKKVGCANFDMLCAAFSSFRLYAAALVGLAVLLFLPLYLVLKLSASYSTHTYQYGWMPSVGFMQDSAPASALFVVWMVLLPCMMTFDIRMSRQFRNASMESTDAMFTDSSPGTAQGKRILWVTLFANIAVVLVVNIAYVYVVLTQSSTLQSVMVVMTSLFKTIWTMGVMGPVLHRHSNYLLLFTSVLNNIIAPVLGTIFVDIDCYQNLFVVPNPVNYLLKIAHFRCYYGTYVNSTAVCAYTPLVEEVTFEPPYIYSGECSSSLLSNYVPIYVMMFGVVSTLLLLGQIGALCYFQTAVPTTTGAIATVVDGAVRADRLAQVKKCRGGMAWYTVLSWGVLTYRILPIESEEALAICIKSMVDARPGSCPKQATGPAVEAGSTLPSASKGQEQLGSSLYDLKHCGVSCIVSLLLLITYGIAYPPLGVVLGMDIVVLTVVRQLCAQMHYEQVRHDPKLLAQWDHVLGLEMDGFLQMLYSPKPLIMVLGAAFVSLFIYDQITYEGPKWGIIYGCVLIGWACLLALIYHSYERHLKDVAERRLDSVIGVAIELKAIGRLRSILTWPETAPAPVPPPLPSKSSTNPNDTVLIDDAYDTDSAAEAHVYVDACTVQNPMCLNDDVNS